MKTHEFDRISFLAGLVITFFGLTFLLLPEVGDIIDFFTDAGSWFWPVLFIAIGIAVLAPLAGRGPRSISDEAEARFERDDSGRLASESPIHASGGDEQHQESEHD